jgi:hypothetical protein
MDIENSTVLYVECTRQHSTVVRRSIEKTSSNGILVQQALAKRRMAESVSSKVVSE